MRPPSSDTPWRRTPASGAHPPASRWNASRPFSFRCLYRSDPGSGAATSSSAPSRTALSIVRRPALITTPPSWIFSCASRLRSAAVTASSACAIRPCVRRRTRSRLARRCPVSVFAKSRRQVRERLRKVLIADLEIEQAGFVGELADAALLPLLALGQLLLEVFDVGKDLRAVSAPCHNCPLVMCAVLEGARLSDMCGRPLRSKRNLQERCGPWSGADMCAAFDAAHTPQARMGVRGSGPIQGYALEALVAKLVFLIRSLDRCAIPLL